MDRRDALLALLVFLSVLFALPAPAHAGYAYPKPPTGWGGAAPNWTFGGTPAANADWINGSARANVQVNVGGRAVTMPAAMRFAANAGQVVARNGLVSGLGRTLPYIGWAITALWVWDEINQRWTVPDTQGSINERLYLWAYGGYSATLETKFTTVAGAAQYAITWRKQNGLCNSSCVETYTGPGDCASVPAGSGSVNCTAQGTRTENGNQVEFGGWQIRGTSNPNPDPLNYRPATDADADKLATDYPMPDNVANEAQKWVPLPQQKPLLNPLPFPGGLPTSIWSPLGEPYSWQDKWRQEGNTIKPANTGNEPWRVDVQPEVKEADTPEQLPDEPQTEEPEPEKDPCEANPNSAGCAELDTPPGPELTDRTVNVAITPQAGWGADNASCPAPRVTSSGIEVPFDLFCTFLGGLRYVVIAFAWLGAAFILLGARSD